MTGWAEKTGDIFSALLQMGRGRFQLKLSEIFGVLSPYKLTVLPQIAKHGIVDPKCPCVLGLEIM